MKTVEISGMRKPVCAGCFEYPENCRGCEFHICSVCKEELTDSECYEYRGAYACEKHIKENEEDRESQRQNIIDQTDKIVRSQADGEWSNGGYRYMKTTMGGTPIAKIKEPLFIKEYERPTKKPH